MVPRRARRRSLKLLAAIALAAPFVAATTDARAAPLTAEQLRALERGEVVSAPIDVDLDRGDYFGGVAYAIVDRPSDEVLAALDDPSTFRSILPLTREATPLPSKPGDRGTKRVRLTHGGRYGSATYTAMVRHDARHVVRFWLDPSEPHDIADCWGYFRVVPWGRGRSLVTYAALLHLDFGIVKVLFTEKIRSYALDTPALVKRFVEGRSGPPLRIP